MGFYRVWGPILTAGAVAASSPPLLGQTRTGGRAASTVPITVELKVGAETYQASGPGICTHAPQASIYDIRSQMWTARHEAGAGKSAQLTFWRPMDKSRDMFGLSVNAARVSTVRGGQPSGSGTVQFEPEGKGGTFRVNAKTADGKAIVGTIKCDGFLPHTAEGG